MSSAYEKMNGFRSHFKIKVTRNLLYNTQYFDAAFPTVYFPAHDQTRKRPYKIVRSLFYEQIPLCRAVSHTNTFAKAIHRQISLPSASFPAYRCGFLGLPCDQRFEGAAKNDQFVLLHPVKPRVRRKIDLNKQPGMWLQLHLSARTDIGLQQVISARTRKYTITFNWLHHIYCGQIIPKWNRSKSS